jgi:hypothetical protein
MFAQPRRAGGRAGGLSRTIYSCRRPSVRPYRPLAAGLHWLAAGGLFELCGETTGFSFDAVGDLLGRVRSRISRSISVSNDCWVERVVGL